jgi:Propeller
VSVGENVVWAISRDRKVWFRNGIHGGGAGESEALAKGTKWIEMVGNLQMISKFNKCDQSDQTIRKKICQIFQRIAQKVAKSKKGQNI